MKIRDILPPQEQLDEISLRQAIAAGLIGAAAASSPRAVTHSELPPRAHVTQAPTQTQKAQADDEERMVQQVVSKYNIDRELAEEVVGLAHKYEHPDFPTAKDILAIVGIESSFRPNVQSQLAKDPARGLMQVRAGVWKIDPEELEDIESNIRHGANILYQYYKKLGSKTAAVQAYNVGITDYRKGVKNPRYLQKYQQEYKHYLASLDDEV